MGEGGEWVQDARGVWRRALKPHMGRRCHGWDYRGRGVYLITIAAAERGAGIWGRVEALPASGQAPTAAPLAGHGLAVCAAPGIASPAMGAAPLAGRGAGEAGVGAAPGIASPAVCAAPLAARFVPNALGAIIAREWAALASAWPGVELLAGQVMEDHFHGVIATPSFMAKPLGAIIGSFKARASSEAGRPLWAKGYVDTILGDGEAVEKGVAYALDNPRRLAEKRAHPELFKVLRDLVLPGIGRFSAIGNHHLLDLPRIFQVQCSRRDFAYARDAAGKIARDRPPCVKTAAFDARREAMLGEIAHGAAIVSPCISEGERELAHLAFAAGARVVALRDQGFSPLYKPGGRLFEACADGRLLLLAPAAWPHTPARKPMTRLVACTLNRIAQLVAGPGAAMVNYRGMPAGDVDRLVAEATGGALPG